MTFSAPSGCAPQGQCGVNPACPAGYEKRSTDPAENYCAGATCDLTDEAGTCTDAPFANDLQTCCEAATCAPLSTIPPGYTAADASGTSQSPCPEGLATKTKLWGGFSERVISWRHKQPVATCHLVLGLQFVAAVVGAWLRAVRRPSPAFHQAPTPTHQQQAHPWRRPSPAARS